MIVPAVVVKILGFVNLNKPISISEEPQEGNLLLVLTDTGKKVCLKLTGSKKKTTLEDVKIYFDNKINSVIKQKEIDLAAAELEYVDEYADALDEAVDEFKDSSEKKKTRTEINKFKKEWKNKKASEIVYERRRFKPGSIIRVATSFGDKLEFIIINKEKLPIIESRCIIFDKEGLPSTTGIYYFSQTDNQLPVIIKAIFNAEKEPLNLFSLTLSPLANMGHVSLLINHLYRTFDVSMEKNGKAYINRIDYDYAQIKDKKEQFDLIKKFNEFAKKRELESEEDVAKAKELLGEVMESMIKNEGSENYINISLNLLLNDEYFQAIESTSPMMKLKDSLVNLNFSAFNPEDKNQLKGFVSEKLSAILVGNTTSKINAIYNTPALKLDEENTSWGFMTDNIQQASFILDSRSTALIVKDAENQ